MCVVVRLSVCVNYSSTFPTVWPVAWLSLAGLSICWLRVTIQDGYSGFPLSTRRLLPCPALPCPGALTHSPGPSSLCRCRGVPGRRHISLSTRLPSAPLSRLLASHPRVSSLSVPSSRRRRRRFLVSPSAARLRLHSAVCLHTDPLSTPSRPTYHPTYILLLHSAHSRRGAAL